MLETGKRLRRQPTRRLPRGPGFALFCSEEQYGNIEYRAFSITCGKQAKMASENRRRNLWQVIDFKWWPETGSNRRRRPFQGRALPLSYLALRHPRTLLPLKLGLSLRRQAEGPAKVSNCAQATSVSIAITSQDAKPAVRQTPMSYTGRSRSTI